MVYRAAQGRGECRLELPAHLFQAAFLPTRAREAGGQQKSSLGLKDPDLSSRR